MLGCTVEIDLDEFFTDIRKHSFIYIDLQKCKIIRDVENHVKQLFSINEDICLVKTTLLSNDVCLYPSSENVRLLNSVDSTVKIKVLRARGSLYSDKGIENDEFQSETRYENVDTLLPVITVKDENYEYNEDFERQDEIGYNSIHLEVADNGCRMFNGKKNADVTKVLCNTGVQTEETSSESLSLIDLNDELFIDADQTESSQCNKSQDGSNSKRRNGLKKKKNKNCISSVTDLEKECDSDCKIVDPNRNTVNILNQRFAGNQNETQNTDFINRKVKCKKKRKNISDDEIIHSESIINCSSLINCNNEVTFHSSDMKNLKKKRKTLSLSPKNEKIETVHAFCSSGSIQIDSSHCSSKKRTNSHKVLHEPSAINCDDIIIENYEEKNNINYKCLYEPEVKESLNNSVEFKKKRKQKKDYDLGIGSDSPSQKYDASDKKFEQLKENQQIKPDSFHASFDNFCKELPLRMIELNQGKSIPELSDESQLYLSNNNAIQNGLSCTEYEQSSTVVTNTPTCFNDLPLPRKRKRKRKHNKKEKKDKLADAAKKFAEENTTKPREISLSNFSRNNSHKFFSDDLNQGVELSETSETQIGNTHENSGIYQNADQLVKSDAEDSTKNDEQCSFNVRKQLNGVETNKSFHNVRNEFLIQQELNTLLNKVKKDNKVLVFEYKNSLNKNAPGVASGCHDSSAFVEYQPSSSKDLQPQTVIDSESIIKKEIDEKDALKKKETNGGSCVNSCETIDVSNYPIICNPVEGDVIMFKILHLGSDYQPEISKQIIARILSINCNESSQKVLSLEILRGDQELKSPNGKFSMNEEENESEEFVELQWSDLIEPRLFYP